MIHTIPGLKGSGKTKRLIDLANEAVSNERGNIIFIDDDDRYMYELRREIRFVNCGAYGIKGPDALYGMLCGMLSVDFDISLIYIDPLVWLVGNDMDQLEKTFERLNRLSEMSSCSFVVAVSGDIETMPDFVMSRAIKME